MKIQCDVCSKEEATLFCSADEAALCQACDRRVHHANKLASKHLRFSLQHPSSKEAPHCDICKERRALLFCREDRAIVCRECDLTIHKANEYTQRHSRFLLTGVKLSSSSSSSSSLAAASANQASSSSRESKSKMGSDFFRPNSCNVMTPESTSTISEVNSHCLTTQTGPHVSSSSITEYLMETLPGWQIEDFLDASCSPYGFCKTTDGEFESGFDFDFVQSSDFFGFVLPQNPAQNQNMVVRDVKGCNVEVNKEMNFSKKRIEDGFDVPYYVNCRSVKKSRQVL